ncbi:hypothetical protein HHJ45_23935 (plasmid) [Escherichia coli]|nr:hypothetical protein [Escherichia coli]QJT88241.1 hypothetical protein HHJ45_23935 [Escherichia coli]VCY27154.1 hypothetical protein BANRA_04561 [Escherichia coli]
MYAKHRGSSVYHACVADFCQLAASKDKECDGQPLSMPESAGKPGRSATDVKGHGSDDALAGGASVVVRDGESPLHGEGKQFECVCDVN